MLLVRLENDAAVKKNMFATQKIHIWGLTLFHLLLTLGSHKKKGESMEGIIEPQHLSFISFVSSNMNKEPKNYKHLHIVK